MESSCTSVISNCDGQGESLSCRFHECPGFCYKLVSVQLPFLVNSGYLPHSDFLFSLVLLKEQCCSHCQWPDYITKPFSSAKVDSVLASLKILSSCKVNHSHTLSTDTYCKSASLWCITVKLCQASNWCSWALVRLLIKAEGFFQVVVGFLEPNLFLVRKDLNTLFCCW